MAVVGAKRFHFLESSRLAKTFWLRACIYHKMQLNTPGHMKVSHCCGPADLRLNAMIQYKAKGLYISQNPTEYTWSYEGKSLLWTC